MRQQYILTSKGLRAWSPILRSASLCWAVLLGGCMVGPNYRAPETPTPPAWAAMQAGATSTQPVTTRPAATQPSVTTTQPAELTDWWRGLNDRKLDSLIERAIELNLDLRVAEWRVREARAQRGVVAADLWPQFNGSGSYSYRGSSLNASPKVKTSGPGPLQQTINSGVASALRQLGGGTTAAGTGITTGTGGVVGGLAQAAASAITQQNATKTSVSRGLNLFQAGFDASWEIDVFGGIRRAVEAADDTIAATEDSRRDVLVTLLSEVAFNYVQLRGFQRRLDIANENIRSQQDTLELTRSRFKAGLTSELDVAQAQAQLATTQSVIPSLEAAIQQAIYQLSVLLAQPPGALVEELTTETPIPVTPAEVPIGLPSDLVRRRPDIRSAERQLAAATAQIGVATADLFPKFSLTGSIGPQTRDIAHFFDEKSFGWSVGPGFQWALFDGWRIRSNIRVQDALQEQALAIYERTVLSALQDVENFLVSYADEQVRYQLLTDAVAANQRSFDLSYELYSRGLTTFLNVLESQRLLYASQDALIQSQSTVVTNLISLYKALGGGWDADEDWESKLPALGMQWPKVNLQLAPPNP